MKIIFIIASLEGFGGTNRVATLLANSLVTTQKVTILSKEDNKNSYLLNDRVKDIRFIGSDFSFLRQCKRYIVQNQPDRVVVHTMSKLTPALILVGIDPKILWSIEHISFEFHSWLFKQLRRRLYRRLDKIITLTDSDAIHYKTIHSNVMVTANPSPLQVLVEPINTNSNIIVSIGRLTYQKGYDLLIDAWSRVEQQFHDWSLHIYGEGEDRDKLGKMVAEKHLKNIILKGITSDVQAVYDNAAFYVMSSRFEGFGMVLIEAQSRGLPIVSFDCPSGPAEIVHHNIDGLLVENGNVLTLAESMINLIKDESLRESMSKHALDAAKAYQIDTVIEKWLYLLESS